MLPYLLRRPAFLVISLVRRHASCSSCCCGCCPATRPTRCSRSAPTPEQIAAARRAGRLRPAAACSSSRRWSAQLLTLRPRHVVRQLAPVGPEIAAAPGRDVPLDLLVVRARRSCSPCRSASSPRVKADRWYGVALSRLSRSSASPYPCSGSADPGRGSSRCSCGLLPVRWLPARRLGGSRRRAAIAGAARHHDRASS